MPAKYNFYTKLEQKIKIFRLKMMWLLASYKKKKYEKKNIYFASLKSVQKEVGSVSISQRYGSGDPDPDPHQNVTDPQHWIKLGRGVAMLGKIGD
jgi:hypothetical protein